MTRAPVKCSNAGMDWLPFVLCPEGQTPPRPRGINSAEGLGDRLRTAAFAELQAREAFLWAVGTFSAAPEKLRDAWTMMAREEDKHLGWLLTRMKELAVEPAGRPVSDKLWRSLTACRTAEEFARFMAEAEARGKAAEESFRETFAARDPATAEIFGLIAAEEEVHIDVQSRAARGVL